MCEPLLAFISSSLLTNTFFTRRPSRKNQWVLLYMLNLSKELFFCSFLTLLFLNCCPTTLNRKVITLYLYAREHDNLAFLFFWLLTLTLNFTSYTTCCTLRRFQNSKMLDMSLAGYVLVWLNCRKSHTYNTLYKIILP